MHEGGNGANAPTPLRPAPRCAFNNEGRRLDCAQTNRCLTIADRLRWPAFTCESCPAFIERDPDQMVDDFRGLVRLGEIIDDDESLDEYLAGVAPRRAVELSLARRAA